MIPVLFMVWGYGIEVGAASPWFQVYLEGRGDVSRFSEGSATWVD